MARILQANGRGLTMIFTRTKRNADRVAADLDFRGFAVAAVHGDLGQGARERALRAFRTGKVDVLVATDVAARGLDVTGVTHVINYDCPEDPDTYTHRIGRTGRAGATGVAVTFVDWEDMPRWRLIDKSLGLDMPEPPETYHTSPWLYTDLSIPADVTARCRPPTGPAPACPPRRKRISAAHARIARPTGQSAAAVGVAAAPARAVRTGDADRTNGPPRLRGPTASRRRHASVGVHAAWTRPRRRPSRECRPPPAATNSRLPAMWRQLGRPRRRRRRAGGNDAGATATDNNGD